MTPTRVAVEVARARDRPSARAMTAASGRCTIGITPTRSSPRSRAIAEVVDVEDRELRAPAEQQLRRVGRFAGAATLRSTPSAP